MAGSKRMQPIDAIKHLQVVLKTLAPVRCPQVLPRGCTYDTEMLYKICITENQRNALEKYLQLFGESNLQVIGTFDADNMSYRIERLERMDKDDRALHQLHYVLETNLNDPQRSSAILQHFLKQNGHKSSDHVIAQQCWNAAFALQVAIRALPRPQITFTFGKSFRVLQAQDDLIEILSPLVVRCDRKDRRK